jgi:hypothetical protein
VLQLLSDNSCGFFKIDDLDGVIAWMPIPDFEPAPEPPEGYRLVQDGEPFRKDAKFYSEGGERWVITGQLDSYDPDMTYCVPVDPPEPEYRPFANGDEFEPFADRWVRQKTPGSHRMKILEFSEGFVYVRGIWCNWQALFDNWQFIDGTPFGVKVRE